MLSQGDEYPVIIGTNSGAAAISEKWFGKGIGYDNFIYITADTGIGSAMIINGNLYKGAFGEAGGIGHFTIDLDGRQCSCGKYGCLETWVSIPRIEEETKRRLKLHHMDELPLFEKGVEEIGFDDIVRALHEGSALCRQIMVESGRYLGIGVANLIDLINPELVIIGGRLGTCSGELIDSLRTTVETRVLSARGKRTPMITSDLDNAVVRGAAALVIDNTFSFFSKI
jgi:predicted NBD/HSP70 family sugar kinase